MSKIRDLIQKSGFFVLLRLIYKRRCIAAGAL
jgi:hypothetical protein